ncbi:putative helicase MOV-10 [Lachnellula suecica]|uniref:Putative helicase MOV-10 n=1 Tax=Lachnellula suecica TaxID=602035 RepID=A0A8T9CDJ4_9HELO|nr:putative helicase MOV-10 [Lachnellula suecica]
MDHTLKPVFARPPRKSTAVLIVRPDPAAEQVQSHGASLHAQSARVAVPPTFKSQPRPTSSTKAKDLSSHHLPAETASTATNFDVYARPFVPDALTSINKLHGLTYDTPAVNQIDFVSWFRDFLPFNFLPRIAQATPLPVEASFDPSDDVRQTHYEQYFRHHLDAEIASQTRENESYSLYDHDVIIDHKPNAPITVSVQVPGLQENSPYVEEDDVIQLRQLEKEFETTLLPAGQSKQNSGSRPRVLNTVLRWTGVAYNGRVTSVQRKNEIVLVKIADFGPRGSGAGFGTRGVGLKRMHPGEHHLKFNIQFPVPKERYLPMQQALPIVQEALLMESSKLSDDSSTRSFSGGRGWWKSMLFPVEANCKAQMNLNKGYFKRNYFDRELNWEQLKVIESVCEQDYGSLPFLVSGPPGTGKTKTLVELAVQLIKYTDGVSHLLFCAPSDPAADTIVQRLSPHFPPNQLFRLNRPSRAFAEVPGAVLPFCHIPDTTFNLPPFKQLMTYKIVVTTCRDASLLMYARMTNSDLYSAEEGLRSSIHPYSTQQSPTYLHWTALLMDEAAQAKEPEALIPLCVVAQPLESGNLLSTPLVVMAGDEHQLGPRTSLRSSPLKTSLFARLFARPVYASHPLARDKSGKAPPTLNSAMLPIFRPAFANLIRNYRSHPAILAVPSSLFYADTLVPEATGTDYLASWSGWKGRKWPVLFHNNLSDDDHEMDGGGWYNRGEVNIACGYAARLVETGLVEPQDVCIMSPFKAQVQRLRKTMRAAPYGGVLWKVDIGPTEIFQGLERGVVIICTTRSRERFVEKDQEVGWGLIGMPNKMNVALTRAKYGLIVVGNRDILLQDPNWKAFLEFCERNGLMAGVDVRTQLNSGGRVGYTALERRLMAQERDLDIGPKSSRVLGGTTQDDVMWTTGMQEPLDSDGYEYKDEEYEYVYD